MSDISKKLPRFSLTLFVIVLCMVVIYMCSFIFRQFYAWDAPSLEEGKANAVPLIAAIDKYVAVRGVCPGNYGPLLDGYITSIPTPAKDWQYVYYCYSTRYIVGFKKAQSTDDWYCYDSNERIWQSHDSGCYGH